MIQMADKPNTTRIGQDGETLTFKDLIYLNVRSCLCASLWTVLSGVYAIVQLGSAWLP